MELQTAVEKLAAQRHVLQLLGVVYIGAYVLGFLLAVWNLWWGLVLILCNGGFFLAVLRPKTRRYQRDFTENALRFGFCAGMTDCSYSGKKEVSDAALYELPLLPCGSTTALCKEGFTARARDFTVAGNEISLHFKTPQTEKGGLNYHFWSGTLLEFTWQTSSPPTLLCTLLDRRLAEPDILAGWKEKGVAEQELTDPVLSERFILMQPEGSPPVGSGVLRRAKRLAQATQKGLAICVQDQRMAVFLNNRFYAQKISVRHQVSRAMLEAPCLPEGNELLDLVRCCAGGKEH